MAFDRQAALAAGYSEEEIDAYLQNQKEAPPPPVAQATATGEPPAPTTTVTPPGSVMPGIATAGLAAAGAALPFAAGYGVAKYGGRAMDVMKNLAGGGAAVPVNPVPPANPSAINLPNTTASPSYTAPAPQPQQPGVIQKGMEIAAKMREIAADKVMQGARAAAPVAQQAAGMARAAAPAAMGLGALTFSGGLNRGEDEELRRRRAMPPTISR